MQPNFNQPHTSSSQVFRTILERNPEEWIKGTEPMTTEQRTYLKILSEEAGEHFDETLSMVTANERITILQQKTGKKL